MKRPLTGPCLAIGYTNEELAQPLIELLTHKTKLFLVIYI